MPIHEKSLIRPENLLTHDKLTIDGIDVSGHWSTFIEPRVVTDYNEELKPRWLPSRRRNIHCCWHVGCTNSYGQRHRAALQPALPITDPHGARERVAARGHHLVCVSCTVHLRPPARRGAEGVMSDRSIELKGRRGRRPCTDLEFTDQVVARGRTRT
jgi:heterodisulfide reductase subunit C